MRFGPNYIVFNTTIEGQRAGRAGLVAGHKKDVVLTNLLDQAPTMEAIYGWQEPGGRNIQPLGTPHRYFYEDYSHGIRFVGPELKIIAANGQVTHQALVQALQDPQLGSILNGGAGAIHDVRAARTCDSHWAQALALTGLCPPQPLICP